MNSLGFFSQLGCFWCQFLGTASSTYRGFRLNKVSSSDDSQASHDDQHTQPSEPLKLPFQENHAVDSSEDYHSSWKKIIEFYCHISHHADAVGPSNFNFSWPKNLREVRLQTSLRVPQRPSETSESLSSASAADLNEVEVASLHARNILPGRRAGFKQLLQWYGFIKKSRFKHYGFHVHVPWYALFWTSFKPAEKVDGSTSFGSVWHEKLKLYAPRYKMCFAENMSLIWPLTSKHLKWGRAGEGECHVHDGSARHVAERGRQQEVGLGQRERLQLGLLLQLLLAGPTFLVVLTANLFVLLVGVIVSRLIWNSKGVGQVFKLHSVPTRIDASLWE